jgi:hypothetical protein
MPSVANAVKRTLEEMSHHVVNVAEHHSTKVWPPSSSVVSLTPVPTQFSYETLQPVMSVRFNLDERRAVLVAARSKLAELEQRLAAIAGVPDTEFIASPPDKPSTKRMKRVLRLRLEKHRRWQAQHPTPSNPVQVAAIEARLDALGKVPVKTVRARLRGAIARQTKKITRVETQARATPWPMRDLKAWYRNQGPGQPQRLVVADRDKHSAKNLLYLGLADGCGLRRPPPFRKPPDQPT